MGKEEKLRLGTLKCGVCVCMCVCRPEGNLQAGSFLLPLQGPGDQTHVVEFSSKLIYPLTTLPAHELSSIHFSFTVSSSKT